MEKSFCNRYMKIFNYSCSPYVTTESYSGKVVGIRNLTRKNLETTPVFQIIPNTDANFLHLHIDKAKNTWWLRRKPELITTFFVTSLYCLSQQRPRRLPVATEKHELRFGQKKPRITPWELRIEWNIFFKLFVGDLDGKMTSTGCKSELTTKQSETVWRADNLFGRLHFTQRGRRHVKVWKSVPLDN